MSRASSPFRPASVLALLAVGAASFVLLLYALGAGWDGRDERNGGEHAASTGLTGFAAFARLLEAEDHRVSLSRSPAALEEEGLLVLTPPQFADADRLAGIIEARRHVGPTLLILPKWAAAPLPADPRIEAQPGWVWLSHLLPPPWLDTIGGLENVPLATGATSGWRGLGRSGALPDPEQVQAIRREGAANLYPLVEDGEGDMLAAWRHDGGYYPVLAAASGERFFAEPPDGIDEGAWPLVVVIEPDLVNNYGMADQSRAALALALVDATLEDYELPIMFDLTLSGLGRSRNLLTLAFEPPFPRRHAHAAAGRAGDRVACLAPLRCPARRAARACPRQDPTGEERRRADRAHAPAAPARCAVCGDGVGADRRPPWHPRR